MATWPQDTTAAKNAFYGNFKLASFQAEHLTRIPGLFRQWELEQVITPGALYLVEKSGTLDDGSPLLAIYSCRLSDDAASILTSGAEIKAEIERLPDSDVEGDEP